MAAFASGLKLAAAFGTVAAKTAGLALSSLATGADKFSELVKQEAMRSYKVELDGINDGLIQAHVKRSRKRVTR
jgi:hypothetical protein